MKTIHYITLRAGNCSTSIQKFKGRDHLVVPIVAMVGNSVVNPSTSEFSEFVPSEALRMSAPFWSGKPVYCDHPGDKMELGNSKKLLEEECIGIILYPKFEGGNLKLQAWLNIERCEELADAGNAGPLSVLNKCRAGEMGEISMGSGVTTSNESGVTELGVKYDVTWNVGGVMPDHLAMLPEGVTGACSIAGGCGSVRMRAHSSGDKIVDQNKTFIEKVRELLGQVKNNIDDQGESDMEIADEGFQLDSILSDALRSTVPAFEFVADTFQESNTVVYTRFLDNLFVYTRCVFSLSDGEVSFSDCEEVVPRRGYDVVLNRGKKARAGKKFEQWYSMVSMQDDKELSKHVTTGDEDMEKKADVKNAKDCDCESRVSEPTKQAAYLTRKLIELNASVKGDEDQLALLSETTLEGMIKAATPKEKKLEFTDKEWMEQAPEGITSQLKALADAAKVKRDQTLETLSKCQDQFSQEDLETMEDRVLSKLLAIAEGRKEGPQKADNRFAARGLNTIKSESEDKNTPVVTAFSAFPKKVAK